MLLHKDAVISGFAGGSGKGGGGGQYDKLGLYVCMYIYIYVYLSIPLHGLCWASVGRSWVKPKEATTPEPVV